MTSDRVVSDTLPNVLQITQCLTELISDVEKAKHFGSIQLEALGLQLEGRAVTEFVQQAATTTQLSEARLNPEAPRLRWKFAPALLPCDIHHKLQLPLLLPRDSWTAAFKSLRVIA